MKLAIVGAGNVATHLAKSLKKANVNVSNIWSFHLENAELLAQQINAVAVSNLHQLIDQEIDIIIVAVKDDAIIDVYQQLSNYTGLIAHTSGSVALSALAAAKNYGVFYPLQTFSKDKAVDFNSIPICLEANSSANLVKLKNLAALLSKHVYEVHSKQRETLHIAAVFACNFPNYLYQIAQQLLAEQQLSFDLIRPLINETANKVQTALPNEVQTGPAARNDEQTLTRHQGMLQQNPDWLEIYKLLSSGIKDKV